MRRLVCAALPLLLACGKPKDATPPGVVVDWDLSKSSRTTMVSAKIGTRASKDRTIAWTPVMGHPVTATLHYESAKVEYVEGGANQSQTTIVAVSVKLGSNDYWRVTGKCDGPDYQMPSVGADGGLVTTQGMIVSCSVGIAQAGSNENLHLTWVGDGPLETEAGMGKVDIQ